MSDDVAVADGCIARTRAADEKAAVSAGMFAFGIWDEYVAREQQELRKRLEAIYATPTVPSGTTVASRNDGGTVG